MHRSAPTRSMFALAIAFIGGATTVWAAGKAHEHGALKLDVATVPCGADATAFGFAGRPPAPTVGGRIRLGA